jgi:hypothetical protein
MTAAARKGLAPWFGKCAMKGDAGTFQEDARLLREGKRSGVRCREVPYRSEDMGEKARLGVSFRVRATKSRDFPNTRTKVFG